MRILNLYAGIGGNSKHWDRHEVTAVEYDEKIANVYAELNPTHMVVVADAHQYLLDHAHRFDFIWSSPPCQSHSRMIRSGKNRRKRYPDMRLYEEILFLMYDFDGLWVVENVVPYYKPFIPATQRGRHLFWSNFSIPEFEIPAYPGDFINSTNMAGRESLMHWLGIHFKTVLYYEGNHCPAQVLRNAVHPEVGRILLDAAMEQF